MITIDMMKSILQAFGLSYDVRQIAQLQYKNLQEKARVLRDIMRVDLTTGDSYVVKLVDEPGHPNELIERQICFSESLRLGGAPVARYYRHRKGWVLRLEFDGGYAYASCEDYIGNPVKQMDLKTIYEMGRLIGSQHRISMENACRVGKQKTYLEVMSHSRYAKIWHGELPKSVDKATYDRIEFLHDCLMPIVEGIWPQLPMAAVHADIYALNNIAMTEHGLAAYDFNLAADEVLLGDLLISWFRTVINPDMWEFINDKNHPSFWRTMLEGYQEERSLTAFEREHLPMLYILMEAIYMSTLACQFEEISEYDNARICLQRAVTVLEGNR